MSRLSSLSSAAIKAMFSSETEETLIMLLTIYDPADNTPAIRVCDNFNKRLTRAPYATTDTDIYYGITSNSNDFVFLPMQITLPTDQEAGSDRCSITLNYVTEEAISLIRTHITGPTKILIQLVLTKTPITGDGQTNQEPDLDTIEASFPNFYITSITYNAESITFELNMISYNREPFPSYNFVPSYFPGLF
jgi:hypothetical protein